MSGAGSQATGHTVVGAVDFSDSAGMAAAMGEMMFLVTSVGPWEAAARIRAIPRPALSSVAVTPPTGLAEREQIGLKQAAALAGCDTRRIKRWCTKYGIGRQLDREWRIDAAALRNLLQGASEGGIMVAHGRTVSNGATPAGEEDAAA